jgi:hypothetical protein
VRWSAANGRTFQKSATGVLVAGQWLDVLDVVRAVSTGTSPAALLSIIKNSLALLRA